MKNIICLWAGAIVDIPAGWVLCDGTNGTPDLRDRFIVGAGGSLNPDDIGGTVEHNHTGNVDAHTHTPVMGTGFQNLTGTAGKLSSETPSFTTSNADHTPPFYALCYIMKL